jgi:type IV secretory pathway VirB4 component
MDKFNMNVGSKIEVWRNAAKKTSSGLKKSDLKLNKGGRVVSKKASDAAKKQFASKQVSMCANLLRPTAHAKHFRTLKDNVKAKRSK